MNYNWEEIFNRRMLICVGTGIASGLPLLLLAQLVPAWLRLEGVDLVTIGFFNAINIFYNIKFLWSPALERYSMPFLGRRRGWMLVTQIALIGSIALLGIWEPATEYRFVFAVSLLIAFFGATQDIVLDAFRREILHTEGELAVGNTIHVQAYRIAGLIPGSLGMILADVIPWDLNFFIMAGFMGIGVVVTLLVKEPPTPEVVPATLKDAILIPFKEFFGRRSILPALAFLAFLILYKLGDNMAVALLSAFYIDLGFTPTEIGLVAKNAALWPAIAGGIVGALIIVKTGINKALWMFGFVQVVTILGFMWLAQVGHDLVVLAIVIAGENVGVGLGTAALVAFIARETSRLAVATQFALFTAVAALPRTIATTVSGYVVEAIGWLPYFFVCAVFAVPGMILLMWVAPWNAPTEENQEAD